MSTFAYEIVTRGLISSFDEDTAERTLRDLWKNVEPWMNPFELELVKVERDD